MELREAKRILFEVHAAALDAEADAAEPTEVLVPVLAAPNLVPVDDDPVPPKAAKHPRREQREVRKGRCVNYVVTRSMESQVPQDAQAEHQRRQDAASAFRIQRHARGN